MYNSIYLFCLELLTSYGWVECVGCADRLVYLVYLLKGTLRKVSIFYGEVNGTTMNEKIVLYCDLNPYSSRNKHFPDMFRRRLI